VRVVSLSRKSQTERSCSFIDLSQLGLEVGEGSREETRRRNIRNINWNVFFKGFPEPHKEVLVEIPEITCPKSP
jgi:hypothetical protein